LSLKKKNDDDVCFPTVYMKGVFARRDDTGFSAERVLGRPRLPRHRHSTRNVRWTHICDTELAEL